MPQARHTPGGPPGAAQKGSEDGEVTDLYAYSAPTHDH